MKLIIFKNVLNFILRKKYIITIVVFVVWIILIDQNSIITRIDNVKKLNKLNTEKEFYRQKIKEDSIKLYQLKTDNNNLEKFAREQYLMHKSNEDVYIIKRIMK